MKKELRFCGRLITGQSSLQETENYFDTNRFRPLDLMPIDWQELVSQHGFEVPFYAESIEGDSLGLMYYDSHFIKQVVQDELETYPVRFGLFHNQSYVGQFESLDHVVGQIPVEYLPAKALEQRMAGHWKNTVYREVQELDGYHVVAFTEGGDEDTGVNLRYSFYSSHLKPKDQKPKFSLELINPLPGIPQLYIHHHHAPQFSVQPIELGTNNTWPGFVRTSLTEGRPTSLVDGDSLYFHVVAGSREAITQHHLWAQLELFYRSTMPGSHHRPEEEFRVYHAMDQIENHLEYEEALGLIPPGYFQNGSGRFSNWKVKPNKHDQDYYIIERRTSDETWEEVAVFFEDLHCMGYLSWDPGLPFSFAIDQGTHFEFYSDFESAREAVPSHLISVVDTEEGRKLGLRHDEKIPGREPELTIVAFVGQYEISPTMVEYHYYE